MAPTQSEQTEDDYDDNYDSHDQHRGLLPRTEIMSRRRRLEGSYTPYESLSVVPIKLAIDF
jgi:hypothetical protein